MYVICQPLKLELFQFGVLLRHELRLVEVVDKGVVLAGQGGL